MKLMADNYEEDHAHPQHHPHHSHHLHPANVHPRILPRGPSHANHRSPMEVSVQKCVGEADLIEHQNPLFHLLSLIHVSSCQVRADKEPGGNAAK